MFPTCAPLYSCRRHFLCICFILGARTIESFINHEDTKNKDDRHQNYEGDSFGGRDKCMSLSAFAAVIAGVLIFVVVEAVGAHSTLERKIVDSIDSMDSVEGND